MGVYMISLIAADMDGTLLDNEGRIPVRFPEVFERLEEQGILFAAASGRQYGRLAEQFDPFRDRMIFIAENGAYVVYKGQTLHKKSIPAKEVPELADAARELHDSIIVLCGVKSAYVEKIDDPVRDKYRGELDKYYANLTFVDSFLDVRDDILKIAVCTFLGSARHILPLYMKYAGKYKIMVSGQIWLDIMPAGTNKGTAMAGVQKYFGIRREETMVFGDYLNDIELLHSAKYSYAMKNAHPDLFRHANFRAGANYENGVLRQIEYMLKHPEQYI